LAVLLPSRASDLEGWAGLAFERPLGAFLAGLAFLPRVALGGRNGRATWRTGGLFVGFRRLARRCGWGSAGFCGRRDHFQILLLAVDYRGHDMDHSEPHETQGNSEQINYGEQVAMVGGEGIERARADAPQIHPRCTLNK
jgi:hypothetical protein